MLDDDALLARWAQGDTQAANELARRHYPALQRFFELKAPEAADDLTQSTMLACVEGRVRFRGEGSFRAYVFGIARRQLLLYLRSNERHGRMVEFRKAQGPDTVLTPSRCASLRQEQSAMLMGITALTVQLQMTLQLYYWDGLKVAEIADVFSVPQSTVKTRLARARELVRQRVERGPGASKAAEVMAGYDSWLRSLA